MSGGGNIHAQEALLSEDMRRAQAGDAKAYRELLENARALVQVYAGNVLRRMGLSDSGAVEDLAQEVLLALHAKRHTYDPSQLFTPWLFAIARYKIIDYGRRRRVSGEGRAIGLGEYLDHYESALETPVFTEPGTAADLRKILETLPEKSRRVLELVKIEGLSVAEAAARAQMSESAVKVAVHRALKTLRSRFAPTSKKDPR